MSIYCSFCDFDGEDPLPGWPGPIIYQGSHVLPSHDDPRGGSFDLASIPPWITRDGKCLAGHQCGLLSDPGLGCCEYAADGLPHWPFLRVSVRPPNPDEDTVVLDRNQVLKLRDALTDWLSNLPEDTATGGDAA